MRLTSYVIITITLLVLSGCDQPSQKTVSSNVATSSIKTPLLATDGERITFVANNISQHDAISMMATQLGFELKFVAPLNKPISIDLHNVTIREALQNILSGDPYSITLNYQSQMDLFPNRITISLENKTGNAVLPAPTSTTITPSTTNTPSTHTNDQQKSAMKQFQEKIMATAPDSAGGPAFLKGMTGTREDAERVIPMLKDPTLSNDDKEAIITMLEDGNRDDVITALNVALDDKDPDIVKASIDAIVFLGDPRDVETLKKLRDTAKDEDVRQAAEDGITLLE